MKKVYNKLLICLTFCICNCLMSCKQSTGISGNQNSNNNIIQGNENTIVIPTDIVASDENVSLSVWIDNTEYDIKNPKNIFFINEDIVNDYLLKEEFEVGEIDKYDLSDAFPGFNYQTDQYSDYLHYKISFNNGEYFIKPQLDQLDLIKNNGKVSLWAQRNYFNVPGSRFSPYFNLISPSLDIKITNNSDQTIFFERAELEILESKPKDEPLIFIDQDIVSRENEFTFIIDSWGEIDDIKVSYNLFPAIENYDYPVDNEFEFIEYPKISFESDLPIINVNIDNELIKLGVDTSYLYNHIGQIDELEYNLALGRLSSKSGNPEYCVAAGKIEYNWYSSLGRKKNHFFFETVIAIGRPEIGGGSVDYHAEFNLNIDHNKKEYSVPLKLSQQIVSKSVGRYNLNLLALKSSSHKFKINLYYNGGNKISSPLVNLDLLMSRSYYNLGIKNNLVLRNLSKIREANNIKMKNPNALSIIGSDTKKSK